MSSIAAKKRAKRKRLEIERARPKATAETASQITSIMRRHEADAVRADKPYAEKRKALGQAAIDWLFDRGHIDEVCRSAAWGFHADWRRAQLCPRTTASYQPPMPRNGDEEPLDQVEAYSRYRWVQIRLSAEVWPVLEAVVLHCQPIMDWIGSKRVELLALRAERSALVTQVMDLGDHRSPDAREQANRLGEEIRKLDHQITLILGSLMDRRTAANLLQRGLDELVTLRGEYHRKYG
ncbi:MAG TPA: hypothetical protein VNS22_18820 [Geminicoccus sp.]|uniref:hypothetical protein n=1 Tax=Geminicoccus sp. TaxID=2024832 RepID=UPI002BC491F6|nr:hypothetical protein [Geminicoccus sp.]HWL70413.1 hypothetical protein [Geminicoccus sp.]